MCTCLPASPRPCSPPRHSWSFRRRPAPADPCPDVELVFARGTAEPPGIRRVGDAVANTLRPLLGGRSLGIYAVNYPAGYNFLTTGVGADDARGHIAWMTGQCPGTPIVLGGFSQGASAASMLAGVPPVGNRIGSIGSAPALAPDLAGNVAAVAVFGNPGGQVRLCPVIDGPVRRAGHRCVQSRRPDLLLGPGSLRAQQLRVAAVSGTGSGLHRGTGVAHRPTTEARHSFGALPEHATSP